MSMRNASTILLCLSALLLMPLVAAAFVVPPAPGNLSTKNHIMKSFVHHRRWSPSATSSSNSRLYALGTQGDILNAFEIGTFLPQAFWLLMIAAPESAETKKIMGSWVPILAPALVHLFIVASSASQPDGTAPIALFAEVFDPSANGMDAMQKMMGFKNFVAEEWTGRLTWDLFVGRYIWLDGVRRGIFTRHSVLLCNLIGPPGLLLHFLTCLFVGKGLPDDTAFLGVGAGSEEDRAIPSDNNSVNVVSLIRSIFDGKSGFDTECAIQSLSENCIWEDFSSHLPRRKGATEVANLLMDRKMSDSAAQRPYAIERITDGRRSGGFTYHREDDQGQRGLRGTVFIELDDEGLICYVREVAEPLFKPGPLTAKLLKAVAKPSDVKFERKYLKRDPKSAKDIVTYLWKEVNGADASEPLRQFADDILYEDFNYNEPFVGKDEVASFLAEFDSIGVNFVPERISEGTGACCFTWRVEIEGVQADGNSVSGISFYDTVAGEGKKISFIRDIPAGISSPPPLQSIAALVNPALRRL
jgi:hypothetical protein